MVPIEGGNYAYNRVGHTDAVDARISRYKPFYVKDGEPYPATILDPKAPPEAFLQDWKFPGYPIRIEEDTKFIETCFAQEFPHTEGIFDVAPGVTVVFKDCLLKNVTVPEGAIIDGGNPVQAVEVETGNPDRPKVWAPCACPKCAPYLVTLRKMIRSKARPGFDGRAWQHHLLKAIVRERKKYSDLVAADCAAIAAENDARVAAFAPSAPPAPAPVETPPAPAVVAAEQTWWGKVKALFGFGE